eukprot:5484762-Amphidinium_carterae.1
MKRLVCNPTPLHQSEFVSIGNQREPNCCVKEGELLSCWAIRSHMGICDRMGTFSKQRVTPDFIHSFNSFNKTASNKAGGVRKVFGRTWTFGESGSGVSLGLSAPGASLTHRVVVLIGKQRQKEVLSL